MKKTPGFPLLPLAVMLFCQCAVQGSLQTAYDHAVHNEFAAAAAIVDELRSKQGDEQLKAQHPVYYHLTLSELAEASVDTAAIVAEARTAYSKYQLLDNDRKAQLEKEGIYAIDVAGRVLTYLPRKPEVAKEEPAVAETMPPAEYEKYFPQTKIYMETEGDYGEDLAITFEFVEKKEMPPATAATTTAKPNETAGDEAATAYVYAAALPDLAATSAPLPPETSTETGETAKIGLAPDSPKTDAAKLPEKSGGQETPQANAGTTIELPANATAKLAGMLRERAALHSKNAQTISQGFERNAFVEYDRDNLKIDYTGFGLGQYSNHYADNAILVFGKTIDDFVEQDPTAYGNISCTVTGYADSSPIKGNGIMYRGEMGPQLSNISYFSLNAERSKNLGEVSQGDFIDTNDGLALMRAYFVADKLIRSPHVNMSQVGLVTYVSDGKGSQYRKVTVRLKVHDAYKHLIRDLDERELEQLKEFQQRNKMKQSYPPDVTELKPPTGP